MHRALWRFQSVARQIATIARGPSKRTDLQWNSIKRIVKNSSVYAKSILAPITRYDAQSSGLAFRSFGYRLLNTPLVRYYTTEKNTSESGKLLKLAVDLFKKGNLHEAYELAVKSFAQADPDEVLPLVLKTRLAKSIGRDNWQHEFFSDLKRFDPESDLFRTAFNEAMSLVAGRDMSEIDSTEVSQFFNAGLTAFPNSYEVVLSYGNVLTVQKNLNEAVYYLKKAANISPNKSAAWRTLWMITGEDNALKKAIACPDAYKDEVLLIRYGRHLIEKENKVTEGIEYIQQGLNVNSAYKYDGTYDSMLEKLVQLLVDERNDSVSAKKLLQIWLNIHPRNLIAWNRLGAIHWRENNVKDAKKCFEKITEIAPDLAIGWFYLALVQPVAADGVPKLLKAIELDPKLLDAHFELARSYLELNQLDPALKSIDRVIELDDSLAPAYCLKATIYARMKRYRDEFLVAYRYYELLSSEDPTFAYYIYVADQRFEEGLAFVREHIHNESPKISLFRFAEAMLLEAMERYDEALKAIDIVIQIAQKNGDQMERIVAMGAKATLLVKTGNITEARQAADVLRQYHSTGLFIDALFDRHEGKFDESIAKLRQLVDPGINELNVHRYIGLLDIAETLEAKGDLTAAAEQYKLVLEINPKYKRGQKRLQAVLQKLAK